jgi:hypothetical protein
MRKIWDRFLEAFLLIYEIFLYSIAIPLILGIIWALCESYILFFTKTSNWLQSYPLTIKIPVFILLGITLRAWRKNYLKNKQAKN